MYFTQEEEMKNKEINVGLLIYVILLNLAVCYVLGIQLNEIIYKGNIFAIILLLVNTFTLFFNFIFLVRRKTNSDWKSVLLYNALFSALSGLSFRIQGIIISNVIGGDISLIFGMNEYGFDWGYHFDYFNAIVELLFYDINQVPGFAVQLNLITIAISAIFFISYRKAKRYSTNVNV